MPFESFTSGQYSRRALLLMPPAFAGLAALCYPRERRLPDAAEEGTGPFVQLALYAPGGSCLGNRPVRKLIRTDADWRNLLTPEEYAITRRQGTEFPYANRYWNHHQPGLYRCVCCGTALFRSQDKFESGTGWPSFSAPVAAANIVTRPDAALAETRTEVQCRKCDAHLGHVFNDGPPPAGLRYCLNSAALRFVPYA